jgi:hypothetical protein
MTEAWTVKGERILVPEVEYDILPEGGEAVILLGHGGAGWWQVAVRVEGKCVGWMWVVAPPRSVGAAS